MARSSECTGWYARKVLDTADIVRDSMFRQLRTARLYAADSRHMWCRVAEGVGFVTEVTFLKNC
jgi:hypothetical protein